MRTYRALSARAHYSAAALSEAASGHKLSSLAVTIAYVAVCGDTAEWEARWRTTAAELVTTKAGSPGEGGGELPPYGGLAAFQREGAGRSSAGRISSPAWGPDCEIAGSRVVGLWYVVAAWCRFDRLPGR